MTGALVASPWPDTATLTAAWASRMGSTPPLGTALRMARPDQWVRFHYLPDGHRIARTTVERAEVLARFQAVLAELSAHDQLLVTTCGWGSTVPAPRPPDLASLLPAAYWRDVPADSPGDVAASIYATSLFAEAGGLVDMHGNSVLAEFLMVWVADALTAEAIIAPPSLEWLVHPYDGGIDVIATDTMQRDELQAKFADWLSPRPDGL